MSGRAEGGETDGGRESRRLESDGGAYRALVAWRGPASGHGLLYFLGLQGDEPAPSDRGDRRAPLAPDASLADLSDGELESLLREAASLTETERRYRAPDGRLWLVQSVGPAWAGERAAEDSTGLLFTALEGSFVRLAAGGRHAGRMQESELAARWREAEPAAGEAEARAGAGERPGAEEGGDG